MRYLIVGMVFLSLAGAAHAQADFARRHLTSSEVQRLKAAKELLDGVDRQSLRATIAELEKTRHPEVNLEMKEAIARAFTDIVKDINVEGQKKKEWLYSMVCLNMAYLQFGGSQGKVGSTTELNRLIRQKLKEYLPANVVKQPGFIYSLE